MPSKINMSCKIKIGYQIVIESFRYPNGMKVKRTNPAKINLKKDNDKKYSFTMQILFSRIS